MSDWSSRPRNAPRSLRRAGRSCRRSSSTRPDWLTLQRATPDGRIVYADINPACEAAYGLPREQVIGRTVEEVLGVEAAQIPAAPSARMPAHRPAAALRGAPHHGRTDHDDRRDVRAGAGRGRRRRPLHHHLRARHHRARAARGAASPGAEDGGDRSAHRRRRARLQQPARQSSAATPNWRGGARPATPRGRWTTSCAPPNAAWR